MSSYLLYLSLSCCYCLPGKTLEVIQCILSHPNPKFSKSEDNVDNNNSPLRMTNARKKLNSSRTKNRVDTEDQRVKCICGSESEEDGYR